MGQLFHFGKNSAVVFARCKTYVKTLPVSSDQMGFSRVPPVIVIVNTGLSIDGSSICTTISSEDVISERL